VKVFFYGSVRISDGLNSPAVNPGTLPG
jgi:hypothetical protein